MHVLETDKCFFGRGHFGRCRLLLLLNSKSQLRLRVGNQFENKQLRGLEALAARMFVFKFAVIIIGLCAKPVRPGNEIKWKWWMFFSIGKRKPQLLWLFFDWVELNREWLSWRLSLWTADKRLATYRLKTFILDIKSLKFSFRIFAQPQATPSPEIQSEPHPRYLWLVKCLVVLVSRFTRYDFVAYDKLTTGLRHELFLLNQTYNRLRLSRRS